jgi:hypothetical protein
VEREAKDADVGRAAAIDAGVLVRPPPPPPPPPLRDGARVSTRSCPTARAPSPPARRYFGASAAGCWLADEREKMLLRSSKGGAVRAAAPSCRRPRDASTRASSSDLNVGRAKERERESNGMQV